jgi:hypothetical protein
MPTSTKTKPNRDQTDDTRRDRRRTTDREAQRASRARTKKRIEELESTIESLLARQADNRVNLLSEQLEKQRQVNKELMASLSNIQKILNHTFTTNTSSSSTISSSTYDDNTGQPSNTSRNDTLVETTRHEPFHFNHLLEAERKRPSSGLDLRDTIIIASDKNNSADMAIPNIHSVAELHNSNYPDLLPEHPPKADIDDKCMSRQLAWKVVNGAITATVKLMAQDNNVDTQFDFDIMRGALLQGWADVEALYKLDVGWKLLQQIDQYLFFQCGPITRSAILRAARLELIVCFRYHG